ncbi:regulatory LuxR family protein [Serratia fonticola]|jgi:DNA-binding CsgD family transcriptional regulator|uniref:Regulatory LuxR family protein n=1 Tax=Serratia fonticola TaxID=47917 RepID=A0A559T2R9_SERFO|nr:LuxR C-terminal-related transcriptional regulator [Serratia fonticola]TQI78602.1 regulatory LuxR family protein [Serratia fonticola]TQI99376.1 regulatory LuxR family protein [Serratia fonticola]TVZ68900.1 regulatory LuxR family protein [Serratia fonticola]
MLQMLNNERRFEYEAPLKKAVTWPNTNRYFYKGIVSYCDSVNTHPERLKVVFVDFQLSNLLLFLDQDWLIYTACHRVILITDSHLLPLANYYKRIFHQIDSVIQGSGSSEDFFNQIDHVISGKRVLSPSKICFSSREICLLRTLTRGTSVRDLADRMQLSPKTVYAMRQNMLGKMGLTKMNDIFMQSISGSR